MSVLLSIKSDIDKKVYDRNDILKKDAYFEKTVMTQIKEGMNKLNISSDREDRQFIQSRITKQYLDQYHDTYPAA
jgi:type I restriction enzyme R subunit